MMKAAVWNRERIPHVTHVVAIASGKGGVGKSTTAVNLAHALTERGFRVGLLDADIHGPSIPQMVGVAHSGQPEVKDGQMLPIYGYGIATMSMGHIAGDQAAIWRGPMVSKALTQMLRHVRWGTAEHPLDMLLIDMPPGTGDIHLTLAQQAPIDGAVIVTTPQDIAIKDALKAGIMFNKVGIPLLGIIENMSSFVDPAGLHHALFGAGGGEKLAQQLDTELLAQIPLYPIIAAMADQGGNLFISSHSECAEQYRHAARLVTERLIDIPLACES